MDKRCKKKKMNMSREILPELLIIVTRFHGKKRSIRYLAEKWPRKRNANEVILVKSKAELFVGARKNGKWSDTSQG